MANLNMNKVILGGRIVKDPELKTTAQGTSVAVFSIAVNRQGAGDHTDFFNVTAWRGTAEFITKFFRKGSSICLVGKIQNREWVDQNGQKRYATDIVADEAFFVDAKSENQVYQAPAAQPQQYQQPQQAPADYMAQQYQQIGAQINAQPVAPVYEEITADEELPF